MRKRTFGNTGVAGMKSTDLERELIEHRIQRRKHNPPHACDHLPLRHLRTAQPGKPDFLARGLHHLFLHSRSNSIRLAASPRTANKE